MSLATISLYTGAGGMDFGFEAAGFETKVGVEMDPVAVETIRRNRSWNMINSDIHGISTDDILTAGRLSRGEAALVIGGPPCQPFSKSGYWANGEAGRLRDSRSMTLGAFMRVVGEALPQVFVLENVSGINYSGKEEGFKHLLSLIERVNEKAGTRYEAAWAVLNAADYGVPQLRSRFFLIADRDGRTFNFPRPTHSPASAAPNGSAEHVNAYSAIGHLRPTQEEDLRPRGRWADLLQSIPEGENYLWHTDRKGGLPLFGWRKRYWSFLLKLAKERPSWTIQASPGPAIGPFHWDSRLLSAKEMAALQTFPADIQVLGSRNAVQRQIGNAVPSLLAEVLGREILRQLFERQTTDCLPTLAVRPVVRVPPPEPVKDVPSAYLTLLGTHTAHPGTGRGPRSAARG